MFKRLLRTTVAALLLASGATLAFPQLALTEDRA